MSRSGPASFALGILVELAAILFVVSLIPRMDLRPAANEPLADAGPSVDQVLHGRQPPQIITVDPSRPSPIEQRLDHASQQLLNSVGSYAFQTAEHVVRDLPPASASAPATSDRSLTPPLALAPPRNFDPPPSPPRPWIRY